MMAVVMRAKILQLKMRLCINRFGIVTRYVPPYSYLDRSIMHESLRSA